MGGFGSGRTCGKICTEQMRRFDVRRLQRANCLKPGMSYNWQWTSNGEQTGLIGVTVETDRVWLTYRARDDVGKWQDMRYPVWLDRTRCHLGGERVWWRCPAVGCGRRCAVLYGGAVFACRQCHKLAYQVQRETADERAGRRADKIRDRLGWEAGILNPPGRKPKWMHWRTYWKLRGEHDAHVHQSLAGIAQRFNLPCARDLL